MPNVEVTGPIRFQSRVFTSSPLAGEQLETFRSDLLVFGKVDPESYSAVLDRVKRILLSRTQRDEQRLLEEMRDVVPDLQTAVAAKRLIAYVYKVFTEETTRGDTPDVLIKDISFLVSDQTVLANVAQLLTLLKQSARWYELERRREEFQRGLFPFLKGVGTTVELRAVFERELRLEESADAYAEQARLIKEMPAIPIITVAITLDSGNPDRFCFQASPELIGWLIEELKATLHKVQILTTYSREPSNKA